jgi:nitronate monooxygenase
MDWPKEFDARGLANQSWRDREDGVNFEEMKRLHDEALTKGEEAWGEKDGRTATYAGTGVGLIKEVKGAGDIVKEIRDGVRGILRTAQGVKT